LKRIKAGFGQNLMAPGKAAASLLNLIQTLATVT